MNRHYHIGITSVAVALACSLALGGVAAAQVGIEINGSEVDVSPPPMVQAGRVFVPLRGVFENLGASVVYSNGQITATGNGRDISLQIGSTQASVDGQPQTIDVAPFIVGASTYVPLRFVSQALGASVNWDDTDRVVEISLAGATTAYPYDQNDQDAYQESYVSQAPPEIPQYNPPPCPQQNDVWTPGYWAWSDAGYYWVPGTWVAAPQPGLYWTPGYWAYNNNGYGWHGGYWAASVGFYGGVNYGAGYYGNGFVGGRWSGNRFAYNTAVLSVNVSVVHNVYVDRSVVHTGGPRVSYNGGPGGVHAQPSATDVQVTHERHIEMTPVQQTHVRVAAQDRTLLARVNGGHPPVTAAARPFTATAKPAGFAPVQAADRTAAQHLVVRPVAPTNPEARPAAAAAPHPAAKPAERPAQPAYHAPAPADHPATAYHAPAESHPAAAPRPAAPAAPRPAAPAYHAPAPAAPAYHAPAPAAPRPAAPAYHAPAPPAPAYHAPAPAYHAPAPAAPAYHAPAPAYHAPAPAAPAYHAPAPAYHAPAPAAPAYHAAAAPPAAAHPAAAHPAQPQHTTHPQEGGPPPR